MEPATPTARAFRTYHRQLGSAPTVRAWERAHRAEHRGVPQTFGPWSRALEGFRDPRLISPHCSAPPLTAAASAWVRDPAAALRSVVILLEHVLGRADAAARLLGGDHADSSDAPDRRPRRRRSTDRFGDAGVERLSGGANAVTSAQDRAGIRQTCPSVEGVVADASVCREICREPRKSKPNSGDPIAVDVPEAT